MELTKEDIQNILLVMNRAQITGAEAEGVAMLKQKLMKLANGKVNPKQDIVTEKKK